MAGEDAAGRGRVGLVESQLAGQGDLEVGVGSALYFDVAEVDGRQGEYVDVVLP